MTNRKKMLLTFLAIVITTLACSFTNPSFGGPVKEPDVLPPIPDTQTEVNSSTEIQEEQAINAYAQYWKEIEDTRTGIRFAIPCYWVANLPTPEQDPTGLGSFTIENFTQEYIQQLGPKQGERVWELGGMKMDILYVHPSTWNLPADASPAQVAQEMLAGDPELGTSITATSDMVINGYPATKVTTTSSQNGNSDVFIFPLASDLMVMFAAYPPESMSHPDLQGIIYSVAISADASVVIPNHKPADPPEGIRAACLGESAANEDGQEALAPQPFLEATLDCQGVTDGEPLRWVECNVQDSLLTASTQALGSYMAETFLIGYWQSEGVELSREAATLEVQQMLPANPSQLTFTTDRNLFPGLNGVTPEQLVNPEINIAEVIYSEGWGTDQQGKALLYIAQDDSGKYYFYGMVFSYQPFD